MNFPILKAKDIWYTIGNSNITKNTIAKIEILNSYTLDGAIRTKNNSETKYSPNEFQSVILAL